MALQNKSKTMLNTNCQNKIFINPNFNKPGPNNFPSNAMHVNPKFSHLVSNGYSNAQNTNKIYINPNFMKTKSVTDSNTCMSTSVNTDITSTPSHLHYTLATYQQPSVNKEAPALQVPISRSRYCLVRQHVINKPLPSQRSSLDKAKTTFKLNKYKTVLLKDIKKNLDNVTNKNLTSLPRFEPNLPTTAANVRISSVLKVNNRKNVFKLNNHANTSTAKLEKIKTKINTDTHKKLYKSNLANQLTTKKIKGNLKKNNIPCPLFRKFGKCLRNERERCEFLHDKKHVSICRKFIKGLCHDIHCLLSHDLTSKKMPTCYFYLQGTCTKSECPYLHVKLNENTKVCPDFVKGYCEKGSKCLLRHIHLSAEKKNKYKSKTKSSFINRSKEIKIHQVNVHSHQDEKLVQNIEMGYVNCAKPLVVRGENYSENRYYEEHQDGGGGNKESCEIIKPMRCKLGTLPSFIQL